ncbi:hypothetical protein [Streptomyces sp. NPDC000878]
MTPANPFDVEALVPGEMDVQTALATLSVRQLLRWVLDEIAAHPQAAAGLLACVVVGLEQQEELPQAGVLLAQFVAHHEQVDDTDTAIAAYRREQYPYPVDAVRYARLAA